MPQKKFGNAHQIFLKYERDFDEEQTRAKFHEQNRPKKNDESLFVCGGGGGALCCLVVNDFQRRHFHVKCLYGFVVGCVSCFNILTD